jgi:hypothetical protein
MERIDPKYQTYVQILNEELVPAIGCTEPIAVAYCAAKARALLGVIPEKVLAEVSGNIIKNAKGAVVPNTDGLTVSRLRLQRASSSAMRMPRCGLSHRRRPAEAATRSFLVQTPVTLHCWRTVNF